MQKVIVVGGGAAGLFAAYSASCLCKKVVLLEKNEKLGKKLYITGKGRCNVTNNVDVSEFINNVIANPKFLYGALNELSPKDVIEFFENNDCKLKTERGNRVFPVSDKASDITNTLRKALEKNGVEICLNTTVQGVIVDKGCVKGVNTDVGFISSNSVIVCTGGISYPATGSTGDGYLFAKEVGHSIIDLKPSLVGIELKGNEFIPLQGVSLKNVSISVKMNEKEIYADFGEMIFTHFGVSGPIILSASCIINRVNATKQTIEIDLKPALTMQMLDKRLLREFSKDNNKIISNKLRALLPQALIELVLRRANVNSDKRCCDITKEERYAIISVLKCLKFDIKRLRSIEEAIMTAGGVSVKEINPKTMESKLVKGLFFAGEVLDVDALTGGFNVQIAFSTGYVAGKNA